MKTFKANSTTVDEVVWLKDTLVVSFQSGTVYVYQNVPESVYDAFEHAESKGKFIGREIVGKYDTLRIG